MATGTIPIPNTSDCFIRQIVPGATTSFSINLQTSNTQSIFMLVSARWNEQTQSTNYRSPAIYNLVYRISGNTPLIDFKQVAAAAGTSVVLTAAVDANNANKINFTSNIGHCEIVAIGTSPFTA